jgi:hypothetical protein
MSAVKKYVGIRALVLIPIIDLISHTRLSPEKNPQNKTTYRVK